MILLRNLAIGYKVVFKEETISLNGTLILCSLGSP